MLVLRIEESLRSVAQRLDVAADLERRDALHLDFDALARHRVAEHDVDLADRELEASDAVDERHDERAAADDHLHALVARWRHKLAFLVAHFGARRPGHDQRFVRVRHAVAARDIEDEQRDDDDRTEDEQWSDTSDTEHGLPPLTRDRLDDDVRARDTRDPYRRPGRYVDVRGRGEVVRCPRVAHEDGAVAACGDGDADSACLADEIV